LLICNQRLQVASLREAVTLQAFIR
jgi:hypothetical protein